MTQLIAITAKFTKPQVKFIDAMIAKGEYTNRSEALRAVVNAALVPKGIKKKEE